MGNQESVSNTMTDIVNQSVTNVSMETSNTCRQDNTGIQTLNFSEIDADSGCSIIMSDITQTSFAAPNFACSSSTANETELLNKLKTELDQKSEAAVSGLTIGQQKSTSNAIANVKNLIQNNISMKTTSECIQNNIAQQKQTYSRIKGSCPRYCANPQLCVGLPPSLCDMSKCNISFKNISQSIVQKATSDCLSENANVTRVINETATEIAQASKAATEGAINTGSSAMITACVIVVAIIALIGFLNYDKSKFQ